MSLATPALKTASQPRRLTVLGSTGSIGCSTLDLVERNREVFEIEALTANRSVSSLAAQAKQFGARLAVVADESCYQDLKEALSGTGIEAAAGPAAVAEAAARPADWVMAAIVGAAGLAPTLSAVRQGRIVGLANKETLVCAGSLMTAEVAACGAHLLPVDSEHNAIFQVLDLEQPEAVDRLILTASGGPFRKLSREAMATVTPQQAVAHPNWDMGAKISVDSATMMNKGLELIEAHYLFGVPEDRIDILVHPQSVIHSMVSYIDGSVLAQLGQPDMRTPIAYALAWPERMATPVERLDLGAIARLDFESPDDIRFPALALARAALRAGGTAPTTLNAANEEAVAAFLAGRIGFTEIAEVVEQTLEAHPSVSLSSLDEVEAADGIARQTAQRLLEQRGGAA
ncbi:1-deoxy-D-xylulose-5-phosphate reductoisomerase [Pelagibius litoralis]|uniref:1-deoxy-D-xylulose 5-phosphate reductoisomerase n=1 Tax=Pelagibius litoralis TaxID=374515 RepID=A0A967C2S0_9PROT|nr:1-deoxy-D-xylulose-5-phosphate reductoisomerase [Pelagibius litoralis]NIA67299.1 1-deoxy-D-xylulose-5-phosphate reductoisomerase [Pelagibius litoralis]